jgi:hypothetical protein
MRHDSRLPDSYSQLKMHSSATRHLSRCAFIYFGWALVCAAEPVSRKKKLTTIARAQHATQKNAPF